MVRLKVYRLVVLLLSIGMKHYEVRQDGRMEMEPATVYDVVCW